MLIFLWGVFYSQKNQVGPLVQSQNRKAVAPLSESAASSGMEHGTLALQDRRDASQLTLKLQNH